ncbi:hypothetical protein Dda_9112 [Drechslerella dactyloides]|uniref:Uncharacterized protein n=1 Tax=Drechslerella dactyloides TaxID=74499 RepID=A0AAD6IR51_DREDA|nr:hypothetical protein Dda_9112 [Drechslerella dactyloides]
MARRLKVKRPRAHGGIPAITVKTPIEVFSGYLDSQGPALRALGDEIDYFKQIKEIGCPIGSEDDPDGHGLAYPTSLQFIIDVIHRGMFEFENFMDDLKLLSSAQGLESLEERFGLTSFDQAWQFYGDLGRQYKLLSRYVKVFLSFGRGINWVPGRLTPLTRTEAQNLAHLVSRVDAARREGDQVVFDTDARERFMDQWNVLAGFANDAAIKMAAAQVWAIQELTREGYTSLISDMDPDNEHDADTATEGSSPDAGYGAGSPGIGGYEANMVEEEGEEGFAGEDVQMVIQVGNDMELEVAAPGGGIAIDEEAGGNNNGGGVDGDQQEGGPVFDFATVFGRAGEWFECWRNQAGRIYQRTDELEPIPYPPQWQEILEEGD